jgi:hypothetical protein
MNYQYAYLVLLLFSVLFIAIFVVRKDLRQQMIMTGIIVSVFGLVKPYL